MFTYLLINHKLNRPLGCTQGLQKPSEPNHSMQGIATLRCSGPALKHPSFRCLDYIQNEMGLKSVGVGKKNRPKSEDFHC